MAKNSKTVFVCNECGHETSKWIGQCPSCKQWNTMVEELKKEGTTSAIKTTININHGKSQKIKDISTDEKLRINTGMTELNRVLGGGIVEGSVILLGGDPGIGKSTLLLQICNEISKNNTVLYATGEESDKQIKLRADRLNIDSENLYILAENNLNFIESEIEKIQPTILILDSIQTVYRQEMSSAPGSVSQVREVTASLTTIAKTKGISIFIIGHVTKDGALAGPKVLEHLVDTVLYFEGDRYESFRILRAVKNRFGATNEIGVFEMKNDGFEEVPNPSGLFIDLSDNPKAGCGITSIMEGSRPIMVEVQSLVTTSNFGNPRRMASGIDINRLILLLAVLEKKCGLNIGNQDVYTNVVGGLKIDERTSDLAIIMTIASSLKDKPLQTGIAMVGEVSLTGDIRPVSNVDSRIKEAEKLGLKKVIIPKSNMRKDMKYSIEVIGVANIQEAIENTL